MSLQKKCTISTITQVNEIGISGKLLMENAGRAVCEEVKRIVRGEDQITILIGPGNNGGDGFVIARTLLEEDYCVKTVQVIPDEKVTGDAKYHKNLFLNCGGTVTLLNSESDMESILSETDVMIDAMLGIGVKGNLREPILGIVNQINRLSKVIISVDIPTGLPSDEGVNEFLSVQADYTFIIGAAKMSAFIQKTSAYYGEWKVVPIGFPKKAFHMFAKRNVWTGTLFKDTIPERKLFSHKGDHGRGLVVGGSHEMPGAIMMTVKSALKAGAGLITAGTTKEIFPIIASHCLETMYLSLPECNGFLTNDIQIPTSNYHAIAIGIGMGRQEYTAELVRSIVKKADCPVILDADGLYHMKLALNEVKKRQAPTIITPHPGEMAMLLDLSIQEVLSAPFHHSLRFAREYDVYILLKGKNTVITSPSGKQAVVNTGNPGLAKGGTGDVLTGITLAMVMQQEGIFQSMCNACYLHGKSADIQVKEQNTYHDLMAEDVIEGIPKVYRTIS